MKVDLNKIKQGYDAAVNLTNAFVSGAVLAAFKHPYMAASGGALLAYSMFSPSPARSLNKLIAIEKEKLKQIEQLTKTEERLITAVEKLENTISNTRK